jgi:hypothetical protein
MPSRKFVKGFYADKAFKGNKVELEVLLNNKVGPRITEDNRTEALAIAREFVHAQSLAITSNSMSCPRCRTTMERVKLFAFDAMYCPKDRVTLPIL